MQNGDATIAVLAEHNTAETPVKTPARAEFPHEIIECCRPRFPHRGKSRRILQRRFAAKFPALPRVLGRILERSPLLRAAARMDSVFGAMQ